MCILTLNVATDQSTTADLSLCNIEVCSRVQQKLNRHFYPCTGKLQMLNTFLQVNRTGTRSYPGTKLLISASESIT